MAHDGDAPGKEENKPEGGQQNGGAAGGREAWTTAQMAKMMDSIAETNAGVVRALTLMQEQAAVTTQILADRSARSAEGAQDQERRGRTQITTERFNRKMAEFWENRPQMWFEMLEAQFQEAGLTGQKPMFRAVLQLLPAKVVELVPDLLANPPTQCYDSIKSALIKHFQKTPVEFMEEMLAIDSLGDKNPTQMLRYLRSLCPNSTCLCIRVVLVRILPDTVREQSNHIEDLDELAKRATTIMKTMTTSSVRSVSYHREVDGPPADTEIAAVQRSSESRQGWCRFHQKWGDTAYSCARPNTCPMKNKIKPRPVLPQGNGQAGRR